MRGRQVSDDGEAARPPGCRCRETIVCETADAALAAFEQLGGDVVVKPLFGSEGRGIVRVSDPDLALRTFRTLSRLAGGAVPAAVHAHPGYDVRVLVLDGHVLGGMNGRRRRRFPHERRPAQANAERHRRRRWKREFASAGRRGDRCMVSPGSICCMIATAAAT